MTSKRWWIFGGFAVVALAGFFWIWQLSKKAAASEPVWLVGEAVEWPKDRLPLKVWLDPSLASYTESTQKALTDLNQTGGCKLLVWEADRGHADVFILSEGTEKPSEAAGAWIRDRAKGPAVMRGEIHYGQPGDVTEFYLGVGHELGHVLGLAHDGQVDCPDDPELHGPGVVSLMADNVTACANRLERGEFLPKLSPKDARALKMRYCP